MSTTPALPYSVSTRSAFSAFDKLQGSKNYAQWKKNMRTVLWSLRQWDVVNSTIVTPIPANPNQPTADKTSATQAYEVHQVSAYMEILFRMTDSTKSVLGNSEDPKATWDHLEK